MDWFKELDQRPGSFFISVLVIAIAILAVSALRDPYALDSYWHLKMGQDWVEKGLSPYRDHYSITHKGESIVEVPILFQLALYGVVEIFGLPAGFQVFIFASSLLALVLALVWLRRIRAPLVVSGIVVFMLLVLLQSRSMVRPELLSYSLMVLALILYERTRKNPSSGNFLLIVLLMLFWRNYHSAILGYVIFFGLFVDLGFQRLMERASLKRLVSLVGWGLAVLAVGYVHPDWTNPAIGVLRPSGFGNWLTFVDEYRPALKGEVMVATLGLIPITLLTLVLLLYKRLFGYFVVCAIMGWYATTMHRMTTPSGIVVVCLLGLALSQYDLRSLTSRGTIARQLAFTGFFLALFLLPLVTSVLLARSLIGVNQSMLGYFPDRLVAYMKSSGKSGRILNDYRIGGYLIYHLGDESQVYIDGRTNILYPYDHALRWKETMTSPIALREEIEKHDIDYVIVGNRRQFIDLVRDTGLMRLDFSDLRYSLYARRNANFPVSGAVWSMPWCWSDAAGEAVLSEQKKLGELLPPYSPAVHVSGLARDYHRAEDRAAYLDSLRRQPVDGWYDDNLRFAGYRALELGLYDYAIDWFYAVRIKDFKDYLAGAMANLRAGRIDAAEEILFASTRTNWSLSDINDVRMMYLLLLELSNIRELKLIDPAYFEKLSGMVVYDVVPDAASRSFSSLFCS